MTFGKKGGNMGLIHAEIKLTNGEDLYAVKKNLIDKDDVKNLNIHCLVDSGAHHLCINENIQGILQLPFIEKGQSNLADGSMLECDIVGPVVVEFEGRRCRCDAWVLPGESEPLLGAIPMEMMQLVISPTDQKLAVSPENLFKLVSMRPVRG
jgi:clan AA aspartic protease